MNVVSQYAPEDSAPNRERAERLERYSERVKAAETFAVTQIFAPLGPDKPGVIPSVAVLSNRLNKAGASLTDSEWLEAAGDVGNMVRFSQEADGVSFF